MYSLIEQKSPLMGFERQKAVVWSGASHSVPSLGKKSGGLCGVDIVDGFMA